MGSVLFNALEDIVTGEGLDNVIDTLERVCYAKSAYHLNHAPIDRKLARAWEVKGAIIRRTGLGN